MPDTVTISAVNTPYGLSSISALVPETHGSPLREVERQMAQLLTSLAESLSKSCVYFSPENIKHLSPPPETSTLLEDLDARMRGMLGHTEMLSSYERRKEQLPETIGDLFAAAGGVRCVYDLFRMLRLVRMPPFGFAPLLRMTDQVILLCNATAYALEQDDPSTARAAMRATIQVRSICEEMQGIIADLAMFLPQRSWKMMKAASDALMVTTEAVGRIAHRTAGQTPPTDNLATSVNRPQDPMETLQEDFWPTIPETGEASQEPVEKTVTKRPRRWEDEDLSAMPMAAPTQKRGFFAWLLSLFRRR